MPKLYPWLLVCVLLSGCLGIPGMKSIPVGFENTAVTITQQDIDPKAMGLRLPQYQKLTFDVRWLGVSIGTLTTSILGVQNHNGRDAYVLEATMKTNDFLSKIYKINDRFVSYMDTETLTTLRHEVYRRDGTYQKDAATEFDQAGHKAYFENFLDKTCKTFDIPAGVHDVLSACYYLMLLPLKEGDKVEDYVCNNESNYHFFGYVYSRTYIKVPAFGNKEKQAFLILPYASLQGKKVEKGNVNAYFSCDKVKLPLMAIVRGPIFSEVAIFLTKVEMGTLPNVPPPALPIPSPPSN